MLHTVVGTKIRFDLWQAYARCHFEYFSPVILLLGKLNKFEGLYNSSLKEALGLPNQLPNEPLLRSIGLPSLKQMASYHLERNLRLILSRFNRRCPFALSKFVKDDPILEREKAGGIPLLMQSVTQNLFSYPECFVKEIIGLSTGTYLTIRCKTGADGVIGTVKNCPTCLVPATQRHFLNVCSVNNRSREILARSLPATFRVKYLSECDFHGFYMNLRDTEIQGSIELSKEEDEEILSNFAKAVSHMGRAIVSDSLEMVTRVTTQGPLRDISGSGGLRTEI